MEGESPWPQVRREPLTASAVNADTVGGTPSFLLRRAVPTRTVAIGRILPAAIGREACHEARPVTSLRGAGSRLLVRRRRGWRERRQHPSRRPRRPRPDGRRGRHGRARRHGFIRRRRRRAGLPLVHVLDAGWQRRGRRQCRQGERVLRRGQAWHLCGAAPGQRRQGRQHSRRRPGDGGTGWPACRRPQQSGHGCPDRRAADGGGSGPDRERRDRRRDSTCASGSTPPWGR